MLVPLSLFILVVPKIFFSSTKERTLR
uniref:Uncharacterized protein n=1 Tax=Arundo donax TaxID=35708 RepID=A0A0A9AHN8_ARUDO